MFGNLHVHKRHHLSGHNAAIFALQRGWEEATFLSAAGDGWIVSWDLHNPDPGRLLARAEEQIFSLARLPDERVLIAGTLSGGVHWIDLQHPDRTRNIAHHRRGTFALLPSPEGLFSVGGDGVLTRWSTDDRRAHESLRLSQQSLRCLDYSPERGELAVGGSDTNIYLLDARRLSLRATLPAAHDNSVFCLRYHPDRRHLLSGGRDAHLRVWDLQAPGAPAAVSAQAAHWFTLNALAFSPDGRLLATASRDKTVKIWDSTTFQLLKVVELIRSAGHRNSVNTLLWHPHRHELISAGDDRAIIIWEVSAERPVTA